MTPKSEHIDQANTLRRLAQPPQEGAPTSGHTTRVFSVTSGKGGVGKTAVVSNVAVALARQGRNVLIIDADLGLANIDVVYGLAPRYNLNHFFTGEKSLEEILVDGPEGVRVLPAGSGIQRFTRLDAGMQMGLMEELSALNGQYDVVLIDTEAGISENVTYFNTAAQDILVVTTPDPTAITDAYALMKLLSTRYDQKRFHLLVNQVRNNREGLDVFQKLTTVANRYLDISIDYLGSIGSDRRMAESIRRQRVIVELFPGSKASTGFEELARSVERIPLRKEAHGSLQFFWQQFLVDNQRSSL